MQCRYFLHEPFVGRGVLGGNDGVRGGGGEKEVFFEFINQFLQSRAGVGRYEHFACCCSDSGDTIDVCVGVILDIGFFLVDGGAAGEIVVIIVADAVTPRIVPARFRFLLLWHDRLSLEWCILCSLQFLSKRVTNKISTIFLNKLMIFSNFS